MVLRKVYNFISANRTLIGIFTLGVVLRLIFFLHANKNLPVSTDEALPGLRAKHILEGEFPLDYWGQGYIGTVESYFQSIFIYLFGTIPFSVRVYSLLVGILFLLVTFKLAEEMYGRHVGLISLALVSIPSAYLLLSAIGPPSYIATVLIGSLVLLFLHRIIFRPISDEQRLKYYILIGLLSGLAFWGHLLYIVYIAVIFLFLFIKDKLFFLRKGFWLFVLFFIIGSLPLILYNITHNLDSFTMTKGVGIRESFLKLIVLFKAVIPVLFGMRIPIVVDTQYALTLSLPEYWGHILGTVYVIAFLYIIISRRKNIMGLLILSAKKVGPTEILLALIVISAIVFIRSERSLSWSVRYILPIISAVPILLSIAIYEIWKKQRVVGGVVLSIILIIQFYGNLRVYAAWDSPKIVNEVFGLPDDRPLIAFLDSRDIRWAYAHYWISYRLTYETGERIICAPPYDERFGGRYKPKYTEEVASSGKVAFIFHETLGIPPVQFEDSIKRIGGDYRKEVVGPYTAFYQFEPPPVLPIIPRAGWTVTSNYRPQEASLAIDGDTGTRWGTGHPQKKGMYFEIGLLRHYTISKIEIKLGKFRTDYPRGLEIEVSDDRRQWKKVAFSEPTTDALKWDMGQPRYFIRDDSVRDDSDIILSYLLKPVRAKFLRITQTGSDPVFDWAIAEINIYQAYDKK